MRIAFFFHLSIFLPLSHTAFFIFYFITRTFSSPPTAIISSFSSHLVFFGRICRVIFLDFDLLLSSSTTSLHIWLASYVFLFLPHTTSFLSWLLRCPLRYELMTRPGTHIILCFFSFLYFSLSNHQPTILSSSCHQFLSLLSFLFLHTFSCAPLSPLPLYFHAQTSVSVSICLSTYSIDSTSW